MHFNANNMHIYVSESPDLNPIEMLWNQLKRYVDKYNPRTKDQQMNLIDQFWTVELTDKVYNRYIDHLYKAVPICVLMGGRATADLPKKIFPESSAGKSIDYFWQKLHTPEVFERAKKLLNDEIFLELVET